MQQAAAYRLLDTPTGRFMVIQRIDGFIETGWANGTQVPHGRHVDSLLPDLADRLLRYFEGEDVEFEDVPLPTASEFFRACWRACREVPRGQTITYAELARQAGGDPSAARAAGQAMRRNPQPIITPCHRVIGSGGRLHGFAGTTSTSSESLAIKRFLLEMEGAKPKAAVGLFV